MYAVFLASALLGGCLLAIQTSANLQLNRAVGTPYGASTLQLGVATTLLVVLAVAVGTIGAVRLVPDVPLWHLLGGLFSPLYITTGILLFPRLGALASVGLFVTGQMVASLGLDLSGLIGVPGKSFTVGIAVGAIAVLTGITLIIRGQRQAAGSVPPAPVPDLAGTGTRGGGATGITGITGAAGGEPGSGGSVATITRAPAPAGALIPATQAAWIPLGIIAGAGLPIQGAINAELRADLDAPITVGMISFIVATAAIAVVLLMLRALRATPAPKLRPLRQMPWWGWLGGGCAAAYVIATFLLIPEIGAATTVAVTVTGQQLASALVDHFGLFRMPKRALTATRLSGLALLVVGSGIVQLT